MKTIPQTKHFYSTISANSNYAGHSDLRTDGPYIIYHKNKFEVITTEKTQGKAFHLRQKLFDTKDIMDQRFDCKVDLPQEQYFSFRVNPAISIPSSVYSINGPFSIVAISDIEGDFEAFKNLLIGSKVMNEQFEWIFAKNHLVLLGDYFDRGNNVLACLWLAYELERQAAEAGGQVHFILGNHEAMILSGDKRYAAPKYKALENVLCYGHEQLFGINTGLGKWLRSKNTVEIINDYLFVHGGLSYKWVERQVDRDTINALIRDNIGLQNNLVKDALAKELLGVEGPLWYRGYYKKQDGYDKASAGEIDQILSFYQARKIITGHTIMNGMGVHYNGKVVTIDVKRGGEFTHNKPGALLIEEDTFFGIDEKGNITPQK